MYEEIGRALHSGWLTDEARFRTGIMEFLASIEIEPEFNFIDEIEIQEEEKKVFVAKFPGLFVYFFEDGSISLISVENKIIGDDNQSTIRSITQGDRIKKCTIRYCRPFDSIRKNGLPLSYMKLYRTKLNSNLGLAGNDFIIEVGDTSNYCEEVRKLLENKKYV